MTKAVFGAERCCDEARLIDNSRGADLTISCNQHSNPIAAELKPAHTPYHWPNLSQSRAQLAVDLGVLSARPPWMDTAVAAGWRAGHPSVPTYRHLAVAGPQPLVYLMALLERLPTREAQQQAVAKNEPLLTVVTPCVDQDNDVNWLWSWAGFNLDVPPGLVAARRPSEVATVLASSPTCPELTAAVTTLWLWATWDDADRFPPQVMKLVDPHVVDAINNALPGTVWCSRRNY
ncbi:MAG: hypothetical protein ACR2MN_13520 [Acidimicrobiales bacterium]